MNLLQHLAQMLTGSHIQGGGQSTQDVQQAHGNPQATLNAHAQQGVYGSNNPQHNAGANGLLGQLAHGHFAPVSREIPLTRTVQLDGVYEPQIVPASQTHFNNYANMYEDTALTNGGPQGLSPINKGVASFTGGRPLQSNVNGYAQPFGYAPLQGSGRQVQPSWDDPNQIEYNGRLIVQ